MKPQQTKYSGVSNKTFMQIRKPSSEPSQTNFKNAE